MSEYAETMKQIVAAVHPILKEAGFRKRRHTFNRESEPGLVQVLNFQMGPYEPGPQYEFPPIRVNLYGKFTINLGIFIAEIHERLTGKNPPDFVAEYYCEVRKRLPELMPEHELPVTDKGVGWWSLDAPSDGTAHEMRRLVPKYGMSFFESLRTREAVIRWWFEERDQSGFPPRAPLSIAVIEFERGRHDRAEALIRDYVAAGFRNPGHREFVEKVAGSMGITI